VRRVCDPPLSTAVLSSSDVLGEHRYHLCMTGQEDAALLLTPVSMPIQAAYQSITNTTQSLLQTLTYINQSFNKPTNS
jgi:hypothetical protein